MEPSYIVLRRAWEGVWRRRQRAVIRLEMTRKVDHLQWQHGCCIMSDRRGSVCWHDFSQRAACLDPM